MIKLFESFQSDEEIIQLCELYDIKHYTINSDKTLSVNGDVEIQLTIYNNNNRIPIFNDRFNNFSKLPLKFKEVTGWFNCSGNELISLAGCPAVVGGGHFDCSNNNLRSLIGGPKVIAGNYITIGNSIINFHGFPEEIGRYFYCAHNPIYEVWDLFRDESKVELLNEMDPLRDVNGQPHVILDIMNDFLSIIGKKEVNKIFKYTNI